MEDNFDIKKYLTENHLGPYAVLGQVKETFEEETTPTSLEETSSEALDRMEGLVSQPAKGTMLHGVRAVIRSLREEGFEDDEIFDYIMQAIKTL